MTTRISYGIPGVNSSTVPESVTYAKPLPTISVPHARTHEGKFYDVSYLIPHGGELANDATINILVTTGASSAHSIPIWQVGGDCEAHIFEDVVVSANGTALDVYNHARWSTNTALLTAYHAPTITNDGTELGGAILIPGGRGPNSAGGSATFKF